MSEEVGISQVFMAALAYEEDYCRIDWVGDLSYPDAARRDEPSIEVMLSRLKTSPRKLDMNDISYSDYENQKRVIVPIGFLPILRVGDVWRKGHYITSPEYTLEVFEGLLINDETCTPVDAAGYKLNAEGKRRFYLRKWDHPYHLKHTGSRCMLISIPASSDKILIPMMELIRFYWGSSSALISWLFKHGLVLNKIYDADKTIRRMEDGASFIQLRHDMRDNSVADIARMALDDHANKSAKLIGKSIMKGAQGQGKIQRYIYAETCFPFVGQTTLALSGKWLEFMENSRVFICYKMRSCTAPFPFSTLKYFRDNPNDNDGTHDPNLPEAYPGAQPKAKDAQDGKGEQEVSPEQSYPYLDDVGILFPAEQPFPDLRQKDICKERQKPCTTQSAGPDKVIAEEADKLGIGRGGSDSSIKPADMMRSEEDEEIVTAETLPVNFQTYFLVLDELQKRKGVGPISYECPYPVGGDMRFSVFPLVKTAMGKEKTWPFFDYKRGASNTKNVRRRVVVAKVPFNNIIAYLLEIERREKEEFSLLLLYHKAGTSILEADLKMVLKRCVERAGSWLSKEDLPHLLRTPFNHRFSRKVSEKEAIKIFVDKIIAKLFLIAGKA